MTSDDDYWKFTKDWKTDPWEPYLFLMAHEDSSGKIYGSAYFLMVINPESGYTSTTTALENMRDGYMLEICD